MTLRRSIKYRALLVTFAAVSSWPAHGQQDGGSPLAPTSVASLSEIGKLGSAPHELAAIGQVNVVHYNRRTMCTGVLIAPDLVLTASECVLDPTTRALVSEDKIHFVAGVDQDRYVAHAKIDCVRLSWNYEYKGPERHLPRVRQTVPATAFAASAAILVLDRRLDVTPLTLARSSNLSDRPYLVAGYTALKRYKLSVRSCSFSKHAGAATLWSGQCDGTGESQGAPILAVDRSGVKVVGLSPASLDPVRPLGLTFDVEDQIAGGRCEGRAAQEGRPNSRAQSE